MPDSENSREELCMTREDKKRNTPVEDQEAVRPEFYQYIVGVLRTARASAYQAVNC